MAPSETVNKCRLFFSVTRRELMKSTIISVILLLSFTSVSYAARYDTSFAFSTIETPHFSIHFHQGLEGVARKAAVYAEEAHGTLTREFTWQPAEKTELVLTDSSDIVNGLSTSLPYNIIFVQVAPPGLTSTLGEYDNWLKSLITHEYAHIVTIDPARGYSSVLRSIFGRPLPGGDPLSTLLFFVSAPENIFLPRWWHEGMATWAETEYSGKGRGRSSFYDMIFRMAVAENNLPTIDGMNGEVPAWPAGELPYLYGYRLHQYIADTYGTKALAKLNLAHAGRVPYFINAPPQEMFGGKSYLNLYDDMIAALKREESQRIATLSVVPFTPLRTVSRRGESLTNPRFSPDGSRIAFSRVDPHDHPTIVVTDKTGGTVLAEFRRSYTDGSICWSPDGGSLYFTQPAVQNDFNIYQDLFVYNVANKSVNGLTSGQRLGDIDCSPDGATIATVVTSRGGQNLALLKLRGAGTEKLPRILTGYSLQRVSSPRWSPDASTISYALKDNVGRTSIHLYDVASGEDRELISVNRTVAYPVWSRDGSYLVYVSDETGVFNLFAYDLKEAKRYQISHLLGGALQPDLSPDGLSLLFSSYDSHGFSIAEMSLDRKKWAAERGPTLPKMREAASPDAAPVIAETGEGASGESSVPMVAAPYSSLRTLVPHFWLPRISADGSDKTVFGLFTGGTDVLGYNRYTLAADYSSGRNRGYFNLNYQNDYFYPTISLKAHAEPLLYADLLQRGNYYELHQSATLAASFPTNFLESSYSISVGYQLQDQKALTTLDSNRRFNGVSIFQGRQDNLFTGIIFDNVLKYPYSASSEEGRRISVMYRRFDRALGSDLDFSKYSAEYQEFYRLPLTSQQHQVIYLRLAGAVTDSNSRYAQQAFQMGGVASELNPYPLRGYPSRSRTGKYLATGTLEYRSPLFNPMRGFGTLPWFTEKVHGALFVDAGEIWDDSTHFSSSAVKVGTGAELRMDVSLGYWLKVTPALGFGHGFNQGGDNQVYFAVYVDL